MSGPADLTPHIAFSETVQTIQTERGSRAQYARMAPRLGYQSPTTQVLPEGLRAGEVPSDRKPIEQIAFAGNFVG